MELPKHGANPKRIFESLNIEAPSELLDFSENVNPVGPPKKVLAHWQDMFLKVASYPHPEGEPFLSAVAKFHSVPKEAVFAGNGAAELLSLIAERYRGKKAVVVHPTFSEYETTLTAKSVAIIRVVANEKEQFQLPLTAIKTAMKKAAVVYLCTPNNPTGMMPSRSDLLEVIKRGKEVNCEIVLDEAFIDFIDESLSFIYELSAYPHVIIVRSMTKMYAIPGIRLGYVVANPLIIKEIKMLAPHWNVNGIAAEIGAICLDESNYQQEAITHSTVEREKMMAFLHKYNCVATDAKANFISFTLQEGLDVKQLYRDLLEKGLVLRHSENFIGMDGNWLRIGMKSEAHMNRLKKEMATWFLENSHS